MSLALSFQKYGGREVNLKVVHLPVNRGKGGAVRIGMLAAVGKVHLMMDADLATDINDFAKLHK
jgi:glycosyltransferase involved in cell wall biosynthesis